MVVRMANTYDVFAEPMPGGTPIYLNEPTD